MNTESRYNACSHLKKKKTHTSGKKELPSVINKPYRVLPLFEKTVNDHKFSKSHSLNTNKLFHCRWLEYQKMHVVKKPAPFMFPRDKDMHFYNYQTCYKPELTIDSKPHHRLSLKPGPGVDHFGEMPIPSDIHSKRGG